MSGGHFDYDQYRIRNIAESVDSLVRNNDSQEVDDWGYSIGYGYPPEVIAEFKEGYRILRLAEIYAQRIDWLVSGDDGEDSFLSRLKEDLENFEREQKSP